MATQFNFCREYGWDEFKCMDNIIKPGLDEALVRLRVRHPDEIQAQEEVPDFEIADKPS